MIGHDTISISRQPFAQKTGIDRIEETSKCAEVLKNPKGKKFQREPKEPNKAIGAYQCQTIWHVFGE